MQRESVHIHHAVKKCQLKKVFDKIKEKKRIKKTREGGGNGWKLNPNAPKAQLTWFTFNEPSVPTFPVIQVIFGVKTSCADGGSSRGGRPLRLCFGIG